MIWLRAFGVWLILMSVEVVHGALREAFLSPRVGGLRARQITVFSGSLLLFAATWLFIRWIGARTRGSLLAVGILWLVLTVLFELGLGYFAFGRSRVELAGDFDPARGGLLPIGLVFLTLCPWIAARIRGLDATPPTR
ncbi:MAG: hypothetical protein ACKV22_14090 [Bryobacteraceae bacterium]